MHQTVTIKEARKILGSEHSDMSDDQIQKLIDDLSFIAKLALEDTMKHYGEDAKAEV
jgi:hypothetical protein